MLRVLGCAQGSGGALVGSLDATELAATEHPEAQSMHRAVEYQRMTFRVLSRCWASFEVNFVMFEGSQDFEVGRPNAEVAGKLEQPGNEDISARMAFTAIFWQTW